MPEYQYFENLKIYQKEGEQELLHFVQNVHN